jgi:hypothetical protein
MLSPIKRPTDPISFGYRSILKTEWKAGNLPTVVKDVYGQVLKDVSVEHIIPVGEGGLKKLCNIGLANETMNNLRGSKPILQFTTKENLVTWFSQFIGVKTKKFDGDKYIENATKYLAKNGINLDIKV